MTKRNRPKWPKESHRPRHKDVPSGTKEELSLAYNQAREFQIKLLHYVDKEDISDEEIQHQRRLFHFVKNGPRKGFFVAYDKAKLVQADVLYILSVKMPKHLLAKQFNVAEGTIQRIRNGESKEWIDEYNLVKRLRKAAISKFKKNNLGTHVTLLSNGKTKEIIASFSSKKKAVEYRESYLLYRLKIGKEVYAAMKKKSTLDTLYPITEMEMIE